MGKINSYCNVYREDKKGVFKKETVTSRIKSFLNKLRGKHAEDYAPPKRFDEGLNFRLMHHMTKKWPGSNNILLGITPKQ